MSSSNQKKTELSELGEFQLIELLSKNITIKNSSTITGIGDDAAVIDPQGEQVLIATDFLLEGVHFDLTYHPLKHLGYKAIMVNLSDIYAMNARPTQVTVSLGISRRFHVEDIQELYSGMLLACERHGVDLVGGDTTSSLTGLSISITAIGHALAENIVYRNGAQKNDLICVSGDLGSAYMGLLLLEREKKVFNQSQNFKPQLGGYDYILERYLKPEARKTVFEILQEKSIIPTSMIDISDGLSSELLHICRSSNMGCRIYAEKIPLDASTEKMGEEMGIEPIVAALNGGEDYELLFTIPMSHYDTISSIPGIHTIGHIIDQEDGCTLVLPHGEVVPLSAQGWNAFEEDQDAE